MSRVKVHKDVHGLFIKHGGDIIRPQLPSYSERPEFETNYIEGNYVYVAPIGIKKASSVEVSGSGMRTEVWWRHGRYLTIYPSEQIWKPRG